MALRSISPRPILCAVLDAEGLGTDPRAFATALFEAGVDWIQLRDRSLASDALLRLVRALVEARDLGATAAERPRAVIVNRRVDIALSVGADGVHLGFDALDRASASDLLPRSARLGISLHSIEEVEALAKRALRTPEQHDSFSAVYAHLAPIWDPRSKPATRPALGPDLLSRACRLGPPILAQGGLDPDRAAEAIRVGAAGIAITGILEESGEPVSVARRLRRSLDGQSWVDL